MSWEQLRPLLWYLVCIVLIVGAAWWIMRHLNRQGGVNWLARCPQNVQLTVLGRTAVGRDQYLLVVRAGERHFLLGSAPGGLTLLAELTQEDMAALCPPAPEKGPGAEGKFLQLLQQKLSNKENKGGRDV